MKKELDTCQGDLQECVIESDSKEQELGQATKARGEVEAKLEECKTNLGLAEESVATSVKNIEICYEKNEEINLGLDQCKKNTETVKGELT